MNTASLTELPLAGREIPLNSGVVSAHYCAGLLHSLGAGITTRGEFSAANVAADWASSGLVELTGYPDLPMQGPAAIPSAASGALDAFRALLPAACLGALNGANLLSERAALLALSRGGQTSANGSCRLLAARDGWIALNLARADDWSLLPAWLETSLHTLSWQAVANQVAAQPVSQLLQRGRLMGLPVAAASGYRNDCGSWFSVSSRGVASMPKAENSTPLVVDLSSLWAGPLCSHLLVQAGARVIKVESKKRPDGARGGNSHFFDLLNAGKESVALDFSSQSGRAQLKALLSKADIVIEGSRPRALLQLGVNAQELLDSTPGLTWVSITGYGRADPAASWVAFGDDASAAAGVTMAAAVPPVFCGDALADPLTGIHAALAAMAFWQAGGGVLLDLSLHRVTAHCLGFCPDIERGTVERSRSGKTGRWHLELHGQVFELKKPKIRKSNRQAASLGRDTQRILREFLIPC